MVTWLKKFSYSKTAKSLAIILLSLSVLGIVQGFLVMISVPAEKSYYETWRFQEQFIEKAGFVRDWIVRYTDETIFDPSAIEQKDVDKRIRHSEELKDYLAEIQPSQQDVEYEKGTIGYRDRGNQKIYIALSNEERLAFEEQARAGIINDRKQYYGIIETELKSPNIKYLAFEKNTDQVITNEKAYDGTNKNEVIQSILERPVYVKGNGYELYDFVVKYQNGGNYNYTNRYQGMHYNYYEGNPFPGQNNYEIYVSMEQDLQPGDRFYEAKKEFDTTKEVEPIAYVVGLMSLITIVIISIYGLKVIGKKEAGQVDISMLAIDRVPFEIQWGITLCSLFLWLIVLMNGVRGSIIPYTWIPYSGIVAMDSGREILITSTLYIMLTVGLCIGLIPLTSLIRHIKNRSMAKHLLSVRLTKWSVKSIRMGIKEDNLILWTLGAMTVYLGANGFLLLLLSLAEELIAIGIMGMLLIFNGIIALGILKLVMDYIRIAKASEQIAKGNLEVKIQMKDALPVMKRMADNLNNIGQGLEEAVVNTVKSERLKTELITNVSHDLKTPLTSIISYVDLLKDEQIDNPVAKEYIEVLSERSNRLKHLVEDLVEASKAATGNMKSELMPVELSQLVAQAIGEYSDRLENQGLEVIMNPLEEVTILADGRHMWRVIENLLSNVSKYAMPHTRVYVEVRKEESQGRLVIKNISKESLHLLEPSELTERFVRGDDSRTTEGSGLGLAIAQSLVTIQGGQFKIELDGDLFKVEIQMPGYKG